MIKYKYNDIIKKPILNVTSFVKSYYIEAMDFAENTKDKYIFQKNEIDKLKKEVKILKKSALLSSAFASKLNSYLKDNNMTYSPKLKITRALSYVKLADYNSVWLNFKGLKKDKIFGLLYQGYSAGIAINKNGRALGLLEGNDKCIFSVYIGKKKLPGVIFGNKNNMIIKYIPSWMKVKKEDKVYTSGLDNIFYEGVKVGKVVKIIKEESYTSAIVKPYVKITVPGFFHIITQP